MGDAIGDTRCPLPAKRKSSGKQASGPGSRMLSRLTPGSELDSALSALAKQPVPHIPVFVGLNQVADNAFNRCISVWEAWRKAYGSKQECVAFGGITCFPLADFACRLSVVPNDDEVLAYLRALPILLQSSLHGVKPLRSHLQTYVDYLLLMYERLSGGTFPTRHLINHIKMFLRQALREGTIVQSRHSFKRVYIRGAVFNSMVRSYIHHAVVNGPRPDANSLSWNGLVEMIGALVLLTGTGCRGGDVMLSSQWELEGKAGMKGVFLTWGDIKLRWDIEERRFHLFIYFACSKGKK